MSRRAAIIGAGPAGFYAAEMLLAGGFLVDLFDRLPTPFGLVRAGVAPDHPKIKSVTRIYTRTAARDGFRFFGCVEIGSQISAAMLRERYHAVIYATGTSGERKLGIPGEELRGSHAAGEFVGWYNGHPDFAELSYDLTHPRAVVIGNGNVALDVARMLVLCDEALAATDTADHALDELRESRIEEVLVLGRRGPLQAAFTNPELRELSDLKGVEVVVDPTQVMGEDLRPDLLEAAGAGTRQRRNLEILREYAGRPRVGGRRRIVLRFLASPVEILGDPDGRVSALRVARTEMVSDPNGGPLRARPTGEEERIECGLVIRAVGYRGRALPGVPFDERQGVVPHASGRVLEDGRVRVGEYVVGWIKRGPSGVIGTNKKDATDTVASILEDATAGRLRDPMADPVEDWIRSHVPDAVSWSGWEAIDTHEVNAGRPLARPRVKLVRMSDFADVATQSPQPAPPEPDAVSTRG